VKAVLLSHAAKESGQIFDGDADELPESGTYVVFPLRVRHVEPSYMAQVLQPFANNPQAILAMNDSRMLVLRDLSSNVRQMVAMAEMVDRPGVGMPRQGRHGGFPFIIGGLGLLWLTRVLLQSNWKRTLTVWGIAMVMGSGAICLRNAGAGGVDLPTTPGSGAATGLLFVALVPWLYQLYLKWMGKGMTAADQSTGVAGVRVWLGGGNVIALLAVALLASLGLGYFFWSILILGVVVVLAYPVGITMMCSGDGVPRQRAEFERSLSMLESGALTPREFGHRVSLIYRKKSSKKAKTAAKS